MIEVTHEQIVTCLRSYVNDLESEPEGNRPEAYYEGGWLVRSFPEQSIRVTVEVIDVEKVWKQQHEDAVQLVKDLDVKSIVGSDSSDT